MIQKNKERPCTSQKELKRAHEEIETSEVTKKLFTRLTIISAMMGIKRKD